MKRALVLLAAILAAPGCITSSYVANAREFAFSTERFNDPGVRRVVGVSVTRDRSGELFAHARVEAEDGAFLTVHAPGKGAASTDDSPLPPSIPCSVIEIPRLGVVVEGDMIQPVAEGTLGPARPATPEDLVPGAVFLSLSRSGRGISFVPWRATLVNGRRRDGSLTGYQVRVTRSPIASVLGIALDDDADAPPRLLVRFEDGSESVIAFDKGFQGLWAHWARLARTSLDGSPSERVVVTAQAVRGDDPLVELPVRQVGPDGRIGAEVTPLGLEASRSATIVSITPGTNQGGAGTWTVCVFRAPPGGRGGDGSLAVEVEATGPWCGFEPREGYALAWPRPLVFPLALLLVPATFAIDAVLSPFELAIFALLPRDFPTF